MAILSRLNSDSQTIRYYFLVALDIIQEATDNVEQIKAEGSTLNWLSDWSEEVIR